ncbi:uncharacterized protein F4822DRAFT_424506 [Hypoxylon trugodes]|uniref:uncharacterized protein n=1 Tax=Hypoxylon trugodes TaxID=326681 RepID=UPI0021914DBB|nr:uncharacterized protein F4822DRAFT_424506 [Hypoxylon trugodes]KAI1394040.1 hypothetical protein F4822DRAFT_424506 [Hypoxylon trugodes]
MLSLFESSKLAVGLTALAAVANAAHYEVAVGKGNKLTFEPETLTTQLGDTVTYKFFSKFHSIAQSKFDDPCHLSEGGLFSGYVPTESSDVAAPTSFTITVNDTKPLWLYCSTGEHCKAGMVHAINAPTNGTNTFDAYKSAAQKVSTAATPPVGTLPVGGIRKTHIDVGASNGSIIFSPNNITELVGTVLEFSYNPKNHSIVQSSFDKPCQPLESGFAAPFVATKQAPSGVTFEVEVKDEKPIWFYCAQTLGSHCQAGMVGAVNAPTSGNNTFDAYLSAAAKAPTSVQPSFAPLNGTLKVNETIIY